MPPKGKRKKGKQTTTGSSKRKAKSHQPDDEEDDILLAEVIPASPSAEVVSTKSVVEKLLGLGDFFSAANPNEAARCYHAVLEEPDVDADAKTEAELRLGGLYFINGTEPTAARPYLEAGLKTKGPQSPALAGLRLHAASHLATLYTSAGEHAAGINCLKAVLARTKGPAVTGEAAMAAYFSVHFQLAELLGPKRNEEALSVLRKGLAACAQAGEKHFVTGLLFRVATAQFELNANAAADAISTVAATEEEMRTGPAATSPAEEHERMTVTVYGSVIEFLAHLLLGQTAQARDSMMVVHQHMKHYNPQQQQAQDGIGASRAAATYSFEWLSRKQLFVLVYLASVGVTTSLGDVAKAQNYAAKAMTIVNRQLASSSVDGLRLETCQTLKVLLLESTISLKLADANFSEALEDIGTITELIETPGADLRGHHSSVHSLLGAYFHAAGEHTEATAHYRKAIEVASSDLESVQANISLVPFSEVNANASAGRAVVLEDAASSLQGGPGSKSPKEATWAAYASAVALILRDDFESARALLESSISTAKSVSKKLYIVHLLLIGACLGKEGKEDEAEVMVSHGLSRAKDLQDLQLYAWAASLAKEVVAEGGGAASKELMEAMAQLETARAEIVQESPHYRAAAAFSLY